jgi:DNA-binding CsgD family transcriptional regulator
MMRPDQLDELVGALYDGVLAQNAWQEALEKLRVLTNSEQATYFFWDRRNENMLVSDSSNVDRQQLEDYHFHYSMIDPTKAVSRFGLGEWYLDRRDLGQAEISKSAFYQEFLCSYRVASVMSTPLLRDGTILAGLTFLAGADRPGFGEAEAELMAPLMPHLVRTSSLRRRFRELSRLSQLGQQILDRFQSAVLVVNAQCDILFANHAGQRWLSSQQAPFSHRRNKSLGNPIASLQRLAKQLCATEHDVDMANSHLQLEFMQVPTYVIGLSLRADHPLAAGWIEPVGLIVILQPTQVQTPRSQLLQQLFSLTPAELMLVESLIVHDTLTDVALDLGISRETARSQLKSVFQKTGTGRQSGLMRLIIQLSQVH